jgi:aryl sulfotransferase
MEQSASQIATLAANALEARAAFFREVRGLEERSSISRLSAVGFEEIDVASMLIIGEIAMGSVHGAAAWTDLARRLKMAESEVSRIIDRLVLYGYLDHVDRTNGNGQPVSVLTGRGVGVYQATMDLIGISRFANFPFRPGDIVISTLRKNGTTWMQRICALLIFQSADLPTPLRDLSPWMEADYPTREIVYGQLAAQPHRRFIKTHLPVSDLPMTNRDVTYIVVARHPLDAAVSMFYHEEIFARALSRQHGGQAVTQASRTNAREWLLNWIDAEPTPPDFKSLSHAMRYMNNVWESRAEPNVVLIHYADLVADLDGEMRRLATRLGITVPDLIWPSLVQAATFQNMKAAADRIQPLPQHVLADPATFFRRGSSGAARELLTDAEIARYRSRIDHLAPRDLLAWLHR